MALSQAEKRTATMHTRRLTKLADMLASMRETKGRKFDMAVWGRHDGAAEHAPDAGNYCGTAACALGWAATDPGFRKAGLRLVWEKAGGWKADGEGYDPNMGDWGAEVKFVRAGDNEEYAPEGSHAGAEFFGLSEYEAEWVFLRCDCTKREVIRKLRQLAKNRLERDNVDYDYDTCPDGSEND